jgi:hypothetical protein
MSKQPTPQYLDWVKSANLPPLTNTQRRFAEWLLSPHIADTITQVGDLKTIFIAVYQYLKYHNKT